MTHFTKSITYYANKGWGKQKGVTRDRKDMHIHIMFGVMSGLNGIKMCNVYYCIPFILE